MADTIALKIKEYESPKVKCATCDNNITKFRAMQLPIWTCAKSSRPIRRTTNDNLR